MPIVGFRRRITSAGRLLTLTEAIGDRSIREVGEMAELDHTSVSAILRGLRWTDLVTIAKLGVRLWPDVP